MDSFDKQWQKWFPEDEEHPSKDAPQKGGSGLFIWLGVIFAVFIVAGILRGLYTDWLWFSSLNYGSVFASILKTKLALFFLSAFVFACLFAGSVWLATRLTPKTTASLIPPNVAKRIESVLKLVIIGATIFLSILFGSTAQGHWETVLQFINGAQFGIADPIFGKDISFYTFTLPFLRFIQGWLLWALIITLIGSAGIYALSYGFQLRKFDYSGKVLTHVGTLVIGILGLMGWGYWLGIWDLVFSNRSVVFGASYADLHAKLPALWILIATVAATIIILSISAARRNFRWVRFAVFGWVAITIIIGSFYPALVQRFQVEPNELEKEAPYIAHNIEFTRKAFALDRIEEQPYPADLTPLPSDISENPLTIRNIRLWDARPLKDTYNQIQSIRLYYDFNDIDIDRYLIDGQYRQVMLAARELSSDKLAGNAQTWVNQKLQFTHGYGIAVSPVNEVTPQGLPEFFLKDIPPAGKFALEKPQIYFGEKTNEYVIAPTNTPEFDYPSGENNVYGFYEGTGGVSLSSIFRRLIYAWEFGDVNILISSQLSSESRLLYHRNIQERVKKLAPFLQLDKDPYPVISNGRILWVQDAYTTSSRYPYSTPVSGGINYIRNSVKAVIDAYDGDVTFYISDQEDAIIRTYQNIFPDLFRPLSDMPEDLLSHLRYPEGMFLIQSDVYRSYHMQDIRIFYNKEDLWAIPNEFYFGGELPMEPYYVIMRLPDEEMEEFLLMQPFTPVNKNNTIGWLAARSDFEHYGTLLAYLFPKDRLVYGPSQIENRIGQDTDITSQFTLWSRGGSRVIRGNLLLIPLGGSLLYVEPVFLQADSGGLPELKRVIVAAGDKITMQPTIEEALNIIFGLESKPPQAAPSDPSAPSQVGDSDLAELISRAQTHYAKAQEYLKQGDWAGYGKELAEMEAVLKQLAELAGK